MGLFSKGKKSKVKTNALNSVDINPLDMNSLINAFKEQKPNATEKDVLNFATKLAEPDEEQEHLTPEGELPWGWFYAHKEFIKPKEDEYRYFLNMWLESRDKSPKEQFEALKSFVLYMNDLKKLCSEKGECFDFWRTIQFNDDYLEKRTEELKYIQDNFDDLNSRYVIDKKIQDEVVPDLRKNLKKIIKENPNLLQTDIYKMFQSEATKYVSEELYYMEKDGLIIREKSGKTYKLSMK